MKIEIKDARLGGYSGWKAVFALALMKDGEIEMTAFESPTGKQGLFDDERQKWSREMSEAAEIVVDRGEVERFAREVEPLVRAYEAALDAGLAGSDAHDAIADALAAADFHDYIAAILGDEEPGEEPGA